MMNHLSPEEFVDALEGPETARMSAHLAECETCRTQLSEMRLVVDGVEAVETAEPSPLFWDHFSARVKEATSRETVSTGWSWAGLGWRPAATLLVAAGALVIGLYVRPAMPVQNDAVADANGGASGASARMPVLDDDGSWSLMTALAADMEWDEISQAVAPVEGTADALIEELTPGQREALARLLQKEIGDL